jgi:hypothetical protein
MLRCTSFEQVCTRSDSVSMPCPFALLRVSSNVSRRAWMSNIEVYSPEMTHFGSHFEVLSTDPMSLQEKSRSFRKGAPLISAQIFVMLRLLR